MATEKKGKNTKLDKSQLRALEKIQHLDKSGQLKKYVAKRLARLQRVRPAKVPAWTHTYGISHPDVRARMGKLRMAA